jgi:gamma-glutamyltranspeptidase / glutathione hydrolase
MIRRMLLVSLWSLLLMSVRSHAQDAADRHDPAEPQRPGSYDRPVGIQHQSRSVVLGRSGMVATSHPQAAQVGLRVLQQGGNAADAAIAVNAMLGVVEPMMCGIGGDLFCLYWDHQSQQLYGLNASGRSPFELSAERVRQRDLQQIPEDGPLSWTVPGCVSGWAELSERFGTRPLGELLQPAIETAENGFPVSEVVAGDWQSEQQRLLADPGSAATYLIDGRAPRQGEIMRLPQLAKSYREIAAHGPAAFYSGSIAQRLVAYSQTEGGFFTLEDFTAHRADWIDPVSTSYRGYELWQTPPNSQGISVLQMLNMLEPFDLKSLGPGHPEYLHLLIEAKKLAFADRARYYADPQHAQVPTAELISKAYSSKQAERIDRGRAAEDVPPGDPRAGAGDTVYLTVVDQDRNVCSLIQSVYYLFGSKRTPAELGFVLQNRGASFALEPGHANRLEAHKRPFHTIIPALVTKDGQPWFSFGVMGGEMQPQGQVQVLVNLIDFEMNVQAAGDAARVRHIGSASPSGLPAQGLGTVVVEGGISAAAVEALRAKGHHVIRDRAGYGGYQGILIDSQHGVLHGASEARKDGAAVGY